MRYFNMYMYKSFSLSLSFLLFPSSFISFYLIYICVCISWDVKGWIRSLPFVIYNFQWKGQVVVCQINSFRGKMIFIIRL